MRVKVTKRGLVIPKDLLEGADEVEIRKEGRRIVIALLGEPDPIFDLGKKPVELGVPDASEDHDHYLYDRGS
jgi:virulence-associated protein VagC